MDQVKFRTTTMATQITILIVAHLLFFLIPTLLIFFTPIFIFRYLLSRLNGLLRPDMVQILSPLSALMAAEDMYKKPKLNALLLMVLEGELDVEEFCRGFSDKAIQRRTEDGKLVNPELQQFVSTWMGFRFWKWDHSFQIHNHVRQYDGQVKYEYLDEKTLREISNELVLKPWIQNRSPWELILCPNYSPEKDDTPSIVKFVCIFRFHHSLGDGFAISKLITAHLGDAKYDLPKPPTTVTSVWSKTLNCLTFSFRLAHEMSSVLVKSNDPFGRFHLNEDQLSGRPNVVTSPKIPLSHLKMIAARTKASIQGITLAAFAGALRTLMFRQAGEIPEYVSVNIPFPVPGHPGKLRNHFSGITISLPVGLTDVGMRLRAIEADLEAQKSSTAPIFVFWAGIAAGCLFPSMAIFIAKQRGPTATVSTFPGPSQQLVLFGRPVVDMACIVGFAPGNIGIECITLSYNGNIRFSAGIDESILPSSEGAMDDFMDNMLKELDILK